MRVIAKSTLAVLAATRAQRCTRPARKLVWVKFMGTHKQYDKIDVESVNDY
jgi:hypothetical protein